MRPVPVTHALWYSLTTQGPTPPRAHATQLQTGLSKENGLAGTRATKHPVWDGTSGRSSQPTTHTLHTCMPRPLVNAQLPLGARVPFPPSALAVSLVHVCPGMSNHHPPADKRKEGSSEAPGLKQDRSFCWRSGPAVWACWVARGTWVAPANGSSGLGSKQT